METFSSSRSAGPWFSFVSLSINNGIYLRIRLRVILHCRTLPSVKHGSRGGSWGFGASRPVEMWSRNSRSWIQCFEGVIDRTWIDSVTPFQLIGRFLEPSTCRSSPGRPCPCFTRLVCPLWTKQAPVQFAYRCVAALFADTLMTLTFGVPVWASIPCKMEWLAQRLPAWLPNSLPPSDMATGSSTTTQDGRHLSPQVCTPLSHFENIRSKQAELRFNLFISVLAYLLQSKSMKSRSSRCVAWCVTPETRWKPFSSTSWNCPTLDR